LDSFRIEKSLSLLPDHAAVCRIEGTTYEATSHGQNSGCQSFQISGDGIKTRGQPKLTQRYFPVHALINVTGKPEFRKTGNFVGPDELCK